MSDIASIKQTVDVTAMHIRSLAALKETLTENSHIRDKLMRMGDESFIDDPVGIVLTFATLTEGQVSLKMQEPRDDGVREILAIVIRTLTYRAKDDLEEINRIAGLLHTPTS